MFGVAVALLYYETEFHVKGALFRPTKQIPSQVVGHSRTLREPHEPENTTMGLTQFDNDTIMALATMVC